MLNYYKDQVYWYVNKKVFYNKTQAFLEALTYKIPLSEIKFYVFDNAFSQVDWTVEPAETFETLLVRRAHQLRDKYDYLRLWYSGGVDSHTVLRTFIDNKIPLDEIVTYRSSCSDSFDDFANLESNNVAIPFLKEIKKEFKTKVTILDIGHKEYQSFFSRDDWPLLTNSFRFRLYSRELCFKHFPELLKPFDKGLSHCEIEAIDKPRLVKRKGIYYSFLWDNMFKWSIGAPFIEYFYITPDMPSLHIKQCHLVRRWFETHHKDLDNIDNFFWKDSYSKINEICRYPLFKNYSLGKGGEVQSLKGMSSLQDAYSKNNDLYESYMMSMKSFGKEYKDFFNQKDIFNDPVGVRSKMYPLNK